MSKLDKIKKHQRERAEKQAVGVLIDQFTLEARSRMQDATPPTDVNEIIHDILDAVEQHDPVTVAYLALQWWDNID